VEFRIETVSGCPALAPVVAAWLVGAFGYPGWWSIDEMTAMILGPSAGPEETFVLFDEDRPVGTASLAHDEQAPRRYLSPWLAGVFVEPRYRGLGYGSALVRRVEAFATAAGVGTLWLYTDTAETLYTGLGWKRVRLEDDNGEPVVLMSRWLRAK
jgi:GNAT superfamily N-acetyltransferase